MSIYALLRNNPHPTLEEIAKSLDGNLCRCTGYRSIFEAARTFARIPHEDVEYEPKQSGGCCQEETEGCCKGVSNDSCCKTKENNSCCKGAGDNGCCKKEKEISEDQNRSHIVGNHVYNLIGQKHPLFPTELRRYNPSQIPLKASSPEQAGAERGNTVTKYFRPVTLSQLLKVKHDHITDKHHRIICGNTELGIETRFKKHDHYRTYIDAGRVPELLVKGLGYNPKTKANGLNSR